MTRILIAGIDSIAGRALGEHLSKRHQVHGLWLTTPEFIEACPTTSLDAESLEKHIAESDTVIFCGGASQSSWDVDFGDFAAEQDWLTPCLAATESSDSKFVYVSSDAVFSGPWVFHDDDSTSYARSRTVKAQLKFESRVAAIADSLIVRTNVLGCGVGSFFSDATERMWAGQTLQLDAATYATPVMADEFARALSQCLEAGLTGHVNVGGAERTTPFRFATLLANNINCPTAELEAVATHSPIERSLRCQRLRTETQAATPLLKDTIEALSELAIQQSQQTVAA